MSLTRDRLFGPGKRLQAHYSLGLVYITHDDVTDFMQAGTAAKNLGRAVLSVSGLIVLSQNITICMETASCYSC